MQTEVGTDLERAGELLRQGKLVAFPTETVYGLGANALDPKAVAGIFAAKDRPHFDPLIVHVTTRENVTPLVADFPEIAERLANRFWPGPLTMVLPKTAQVPDLVTSGLPTVAVRVPHHPLAQKLLETARVPVAAPSANRFGQLSPTRAEHVREQLDGRIDYLLDGGSCPVGVESTVLDVTTHPPQLLRPGGIPLEDLEHLLGEVVVIESSLANETPTAPGMLTKHYAPNTRVIVVDSLNQLSLDRGRCALLTLAKLPDQNEMGQFLGVECLSESGDLTEAATQFFAALRRLDEVKADQIVAVRFPNHGLGRALNDRLKRAANSW